MSAEANAPNTPLRRRATAIVTRDGRALLVRDRGRQAFALPGGGVQRGEMPIYALARELHEETTLAATAVAYIATHSGKYNRHYVFGVQACGEVDVSRDATVEEFAWWDGASDIPVHPHVTQILSGLWHNIGGANTDLHPAHSAHPPSIADARTKRGARIRRRATVVVIRNGKFLMMREPGDAEFFLPGGGVEHAELPICAAIRELREETGMTATAVRHLLDHCDFWGGDQSAFWKSSARYWGQTQSVFVIEAQGDVKLSAEHAEFVWWNGSPELPLPQDASPLMRLIRPEWQRQSNANATQATV